jgi:hypothetical protein
MTIASFTYCHTSHHSCRTQYYLSIFLVFFRTTTVQVDYCSLLVLVVGHRSPMMFVAQTLERPE